ncbi:MAG TPA: hypothetical protein VLZ06_02875 [Solirubrobacteraceae bacterium]|nr:hypothetical protein [Solirubrobacteraceae bacterium]
MAVASSLTLAVSPGVAGAKHHRAGHRHRSAHPAAETTQAYLRVPAQAKKTIDELNLEVEYKAFTMTLPGNQTFAGSWTPDGRNHRYAGETTGSASHRPHELYMEKGNLELPLTGPGGKTATFEADPVINAIRADRHQGLDLYLMARGQLEIRAALHQIVFAFQSEAYGGGQPCYYAAKKLKGTYSYVPGGETVLEPVVSARMSLFDEAESHFELCPASVVVKATLIAENAPGEPVTVVYP